MTVTRAVSRLGGAVLSAAPLLAFTVLARPLAAQQRQVDAHATCSQTTQTHSASWGAGAQRQLVFGGKQSPVNLGTSAGLDYLKQEHDGPSQWNVSYDAVVQPGGGGTLTPYVGGSLSANWSAGDQAQWSGARLGLETIGGAQVKLTPDGPTLKIEERFGYVRGQEHTPGTQFGVQFSL